MVENESKVVKRGIATWLFVLVLVLMSFSFLINLILLLSLSVHLAASGGTGEEEFLQQYDERTIGGEKDAAAKILRLPITGVLVSKKSREGGIVDYVTGSLKQATKDVSIKAIILDINSPGGGITECDKIYREIARFKKARPEVKIIASMDSVAASGGYYISMLADKILAQSTTITGSIGVISYRPDVEGLLEKIGVRAQVIKSGSKKDMGSPFRKMTKEEEDILQNIINEMYEKFVNIVCSGRKNLTRETILKLADGRVYTGEQALKNGLIDEIGDFEDSVQLAKKLANLPKARVQEYTKKVSFLEGLFGIKSSYPPILQELYEFVPQRTESRFFYLWRGI